VDALIGLMVCASLVGLVVGLLMCLSGAKRYQGKRVALGSVTSFAMLVGIAVARGPVTPVAAGPTPTASQAVASVKQTYVEPKPENLSKSQMLANFRVKNLSWQKEGFGMIMEARFSVHNDNPMAVRDIEITCSSSGPSGSIIDTNSRTVFEVVRGRSYVDVEKMNMGFIRSEAVETKCRVTGFSKA
jgi:hypothetical protein